MKVFRDWMWRLTPLAMFLVLIGLAPSAVVAQEVPYAAIVTEDTVQVRAGAGRAYYVVGELSRNTRVEVDEVIFGWLKIVPPEGVYSYVSKAFVDAEGDGKTGKVNANRTRVTAASIDGPGSSYREQTLLNRGAKVTILEEKGSFYKIEPPQGTYVFLPPGSVRRAADMEAAQQPATEPEHTQPVDEPQPQPKGEADDVTDDASADEQTADAAGADRDMSSAADTQADRDDAASAASGSADAAVDAPDDADVNRSDDDATAQADAEAETTGGADTDTSAASAETSPAESAEIDDADVADAGDDGTDASAEADVVEAPREPVETPAISDALREVEQRHVPSFDLPLEDQPFERMIADYRQVREREGGNLPDADRRLIEHRLAAMERNQRLAATLIRLNSVREQADRTDREIEASREARERRRSDYDAVGELLASTVYDGQSLPRLYRLVDPTTGRTIGYVEPSDAVEPRNMLGRVVGIIGDRHLDPGLRLRVFDVRRVDVLETSNSSQSVD